MALAAFTLVFAAVDFQSQVSARIDRSGLDNVSYLSVVALASERNAELQPNTSAETQRRNLLDEANKAELAAEAARTEYDVARNELDNAVSAMAATLNCKGSGQEFLPIDILSCEVPGVVAGEGAEAVLAQRTEEAERLTRRAISARDRFNQALADTNTKTVLADQARRRLELYTSGIEEVPTASNENDALGRLVSGVMFDLRVMSQTARTLDYLIRLPPIINSILLVSLAGLLGALMIIIFLRVFPNASDAFQSQRGFGIFNRMFLGSLIAVVVFLAMGSTTLILNPGQSVSGSIASSALSISLVGVLAGAFSGQVAHWLAVKAADIFNPDKDAPVPSAPAPAPLPDDAAAPAIPAPQDEPHPEQAAEEKPAGR